jgi:nucleotide-binding universal stress UspA family protein
LVALRFAEIMARAHGAVLVPVIAWVPPGGDRADQIQPSGQLRQQWQEMAARRLRDALAMVWGRVPDDLPLDPRVERGPAGWVLVNVACRDGDVLLVGAGRRGPLRRILACRVGRYCVAHASCPVMLVPPPDLARDMTRLRLAWQLRRGLTPRQVLRDQAGPAAV